MSKLAASKRTGTVASPGTAQTLAMASIHRRPAILAAPMARELGIAVPTVFAAFSVAHVVSASIGPRSGAAIDRLGGRPVPMATSVVLAGRLAGLGMSRGVGRLFAAWIVLGIGMGGGRYGSAFASLVRLYGRDARTSITGITLIAGLAGTVGGPVPAWLESPYGWRHACFTWAALQLLVGLPLDARLPRRAPASEPAVAPGSPAIEGQPPDEAPAGRSVLTLSFVFASTGFIRTVLAAHPPRLMQAAGATLATAVRAGTLIGPAQAAALSARLASAMHPIGMGALLVGGPALAPLFGVLHGAGNGIRTIARGTLSLVLFGSTGHGARQGWPMVPARVAQALAPFLFGVALDRLQAGALWATAGLGLAAFAALPALRAPAPADAPGILSPGPSR